MATINKYNFFFRKENKILLEWHNFSCISSLRTKKPNIFYDISREMVDNDFWKQAIYISTLFIYAILIIFYIDNQTYDQQSEKIMPNYLSQSVIMKSFP